MSTGNHDSGVFELNSDGERYLPFEGAGVVSRWKLELPNPFRQFDYNSIADVLFTIQFTSLEGGAIWRDEAAQSAHDFRANINKDIGNDGAFLLVNLSSNFASEWHQFRARISAVADADMEKEGLACNSIYPSGRLKSLK